MMKNLLFLFIPLLCFLYTCDNKSSNIGDPFIKEISKNDTDSLYRYPRIIKNSAPGLQLVKNIWEDEVLLHVEEGDFLMLKKVSDERFIAISYEDTEGSYYYRFFDFNIDGEILYTFILDDTDCSIDNKFNFRIDADTIYYFTSEKTQNTYSYSLKDKVHNKSYPENLDWENINSWHSETEYLSNDGNKEIILYDVLLVVKQEGLKDDTLIHQEYDGTWSFRQGTWSLDDSKFYFDNSGAVACIWEIDFDNRTLDKIIPDHWAKAPVYVYDQTDAILYCLDDKIRISRKN